MRNTKRRGPRNSRLAHYSIITQTFSDVPVVSIKQAEYLPIEDKDIARDWDIIEQDEFILDLMTTCSHQEAENPYEREPHKVIPMPTSTKPLAHSYSALKQYEICPRQYEKQRITREVKATFGEASIYGIRIHEHLEARITNQTPLPEEAVQYEGLIEAFKSLPGELLAEHELVLDKDLQPTGWWDKGAWLRSKLDILVLNGPDAVVADWKTGKRRPDSFQMELFALQVFIHYPDIERVRTTLVWLKDMKMDTESYERENLSTLLGVLMTKVHRIEQSLEKNNWPPKPSGLCPWCPAKDICEFG